jgi:CysZ protein
MDILKVFPLSFKVIVRDPINFLLAMIPTGIALSLYLGLVFSIWNNSDRFVSLFRGHIYTADQATLFARILTTILIIFIFFLMSWTFIIVVGIIAAPFNSLLSERIEKKLLQDKLTANRHEAYIKIQSSIGQIFKNEFKKLIFLVLVGMLAFLLNLFPLFYPVGIFLVATLLAVQFVDYSWSRHHMHFNSCLKDLFLNLWPFSAGGFLFLLLIAIPIINAFIPALATSYFTILWLMRQKKISLN